MLIDSYRHIARDPYFSNVVLLMRMNGNGSDLAGTQMNVAGTVSYAGGRFSQGASLQSGDSGFINNVANDSDFNFGTGDFTVEIWVKPNTDQTGESALVSHFDVISTNGWQLLLNNGSPWFYRYVSVGNNALTLTGVDLRDGLWHHLALVRSSGFVRIYVDGVLPENGTASDSVNYGSNGIVLSVGYQAQGQARYPYRGMLDELRITKGVARYTANFTPPTAPFPDTP